MKLSLVAALFVALGILATMLGGGAALAQQNVCGTNPDPVDATDPSIIVTAPIANASVTSPLHVTGQARVFEATVSLKLVDATGNELVATTTQAAEGQVLSPFSADVSFSVTSSSSACLWVYEVSAKDGSPVNVVQVPLTLTVATTPTAAPVLPSTGMGGTSESGQVAWLIGALAIAGFGVTGGAVAVRRVRA